MCKYKLLLLLLVSSVTAFAQFTKNETVSTAIQNMTGGAADWGDFDNDGDLDLAIGGGLGGLYTQIYRNDDGIFVDINANLKEAYASSMMWGDFDNDGDLDLLYSGQSTEGEGVDRVDIVITRIYRNDNGIFTDYNADLLGAYNGTTEWGDLDNDGDLDIATIGLTVDGDHIFKIYKNDNGIFNELAVPTQPNINASASINWGDYDNDNDLDLLVTGLGFNEARDDFMTTVLRNDAGIFVDAGISLPGLVDSNGKWGDYDNDGDLDIALAGANINDDFVSYIYENINGEFTDIGAPSVDIRAPSIVWVDYDTDHDLDLIISGLNNVDSYVPNLFKNDNGVFVDAAIELPSTWEEVVPGDYDNDGDPDLVFFEVMEDFSAFTNLYDNVLKDGQIITFDPLPNKTYGDAAFELVATSSSALPVSFEIVSGPGILTGNTVTITGAGDIVIEASQSGSVDFNPAQTKRQTLPIDKAVLTASAEDKNMVYGQALPTFTATYSGFILSDDQTAILEAPTLSTNASDAGMHTISASGGVADNYTFNYVDGTLTINKAPLTVSVSDQTITYGMNIPTLTYVYTGFVNGDNDTNLISEPSITTTGTATSDVGIYDITLSGGDASNYNISLIDGSLTINPASLTVNANNKTITYGMNIPTLTYQYSSFVNGQDATVLITEPSISTTADINSNAGTYAISLAGGSADNYNISHENGTLTINQAALTVTADNKTITYGDALPALTFSYDGFVNGQDATMLTAEPTINTGAVNNSDAGSYPIILTNGSADNYGLTLINGELTINQATATISATDLEQIFDGTTKEATIVTDPEDLTYVATYNGNQTSPSDIGSYDLEVTIDDINYKGQSTATFIIQLISGFGHDASNPLTIYPMPATQTINIAGDVSNISQTQIYNLNGQVVLNEQFKKQLDIEHLKSGHYILKLIDQSGLTIYTQNIIIK